MALGSRSTHRGFSLIELLIVVAIIGIIAVIAIPNLMNAIQRSRQSRTMADIRVLGEAVELYQQDHSFYPRAPGTVSADVLHPFLTNCIDSVS